MQAAPGGVKKCTQDLLSKMADVPPSFRSYFTNFYLNFEDIRRAAMSGDFSAVKIGHFRCDDGKIEDHPGRTAFITWAIEQIRKDGGIFFQGLLLARWSGMPEDARRAICKRNPASFFELRGGVRISFESLKSQAAQDDGRVSGVDDPYSPWAAHSPTWGPTQGAAAADAPPPPPPPPAASSGWPAPADNAARPRHTHRTRL